MRLMPGLYTSTSGLADVALGGSRLDIPVESESEWSWRTLLDRIVHVGWE